MMLRVPLLIVALALMTKLSSAQTPPVRSLCDLVAGAEATNGKEFTIQAIYAQTFHGALVTDDGCRSTKANVTFTSGYKASPAALKMLKKIAREGNEALLTFHAIFRVAHKEQCFGQNCEPFQVEVDEIISVVRPNPKVGEGLSHEAAGHAQGKSTP
jgi:hypothetical protein